MNKKLTIVGLVGLFIVGTISMPGCSAQNSSSIVLEKVKERRESQEEKEFFEGGFFFNKEDQAENKQKQTILEEKQEVSDDFFDRSFQLVFFGDSLTQGVGDSTGKGGFTPFVKEHYLSKSYIDEVSITNLGVRGNRTNHLLKRLKQPEVQESLKSADVIFMTVGGNDLMKVIRENFLDLNFELFEREQEEYAERLETVISEVRKNNPDSTIYIVGLFNPFYEFFKEIPEMNEVVTNWNETTISVLENHPKTVFVPIQDLFIDTDVNLLDDDQFHPNEKGYQLIGTEIVNQVIEYNEEVLTDENVLQERE
ncbi:lysophospholipase L1-like esterase [Bacillus tianshenii]|uniref:Lysophospholipase L1-like esterase n=1 Tax=Sutcliffiella tianshenii TaxID=1463404 RepID=A0ABS2NXL2_9BACI|nr:SGNH/GDSL hydrolase family protein [Bacillus tianshenii]MBM7619411.1 lysophospholipase L1-like esterase [Bacillus tianshenii]